MIGDSVRLIRAFVRKGAYSLKQHAHQRMVEREIFSEDLEAVILLGDVVEENPENFPCPTWTFMRFVRGAPLYVVCAFDGKRVYVVTVHWQDSAKWSDPWTRK